MLFNSIEFIIFFIVVLHLYYVIPHTYRWILLLSASCLFYMAFVPIYLLILLFTIVIDYYAGIFIEQSKARKRLFLVVSIIANVSILFVFKYYNFFIDNFNTLSQSNWPLLKILLPIGLSFHTFQAMSYTIEVYQGNQKAERHFGIYALYVMFFPQLVAGPIERPQNILNQFYIQQSFQYANIVNGLKLMAWGMFKKVVIADRLAVFVNQVFNHHQDYEGISILIAAVFFSFQIYFDFSGYSDIAIGSAKTLGIDLMTNFDRPYLSVSISEFWKKWHISLSTWFRDYVYIPMGGNKVAKWRSYMNQFIVFLISGFWHGANWTFILWGALHAIFVFVERIFKWPRLFTSHGLFSSFLKGLFLFTCVTLAWIFFRADSIRIAFAMIVRSTQHIGTQLLAIIHNTNNERLQFLYLNQSMIQFISSVFLILSLLGFEYFQKQRTFLQFVHGFPLIYRWAFYSILVYGSILMGVFESSQFIYFQF